MENQHPPSKYPSRTQLRNHAWKTGYIMGLKEAETNRYMRQDTKKRTAQRKWEESKPFSVSLDTRETAQRHELHDSPWVWLAAPLLLLALLVVGWVRSLIGV